MLLDNNITMTAIAINTKLRYDVIKYICYLKKNTAITTIVIPTRIILHVPFLQYPLPLYLESLRTWNGFPLPEGHTA